MSVVVTTRLHDIDFSRSWPDTVDGIGWHHPDGWPEPVTSWELCLNFNSSKFDVRTKLCVDTTGLDRVDDSAVGGVGGDDAVTPKGGCAGTVSEKVDGGVLLDQGSILEGRLDVEHAILDEDVLLSGSGLLELSVSVTCQS